jgi:hypothetical protein
MAMFAQMVARSTGASERHLVDERPALRVFSAVVVGSNCGKG